MDIKTHQLVKDLNVNMDLNKDNILKNVNSGKAEVFNKLTQTETVRVLGGNEKTQKSTIEQLEEVLHFLKSAKINTNEEALNVIQKPLDDLQSSLKYIPNGKHFSILPTEIKMNIMSYLCDSNAFTAASVCEEWKVMLGSRFKEVDTVTIGTRHCGHKIYIYRCDESNDCAKGISKHLSPEVMLKAAALHKLNDHMKIIDNRNVSQVHSKVVTKGLLGVSRFTLSGSNPLSFDQLDKLFKGLEEGDKVMKYVQLCYVELTNLNQDRLVHCLADKMKSLDLHGHWGYSLKLETVKQLLDTIIARPVKLKSLFLSPLDFSTLINPEDLKELLNRMNKSKSEVVLSTTKL